MIKTFMLATPNPKHTREECQDYLGNRHPRHAMSVESLEDTFKLYSMNFVQLESDVPAAPTLCNREDSFMMCVEICCESREAYEEELADEEYLNIVRPDENYMIREFQGAAPIFYQVDEDVLYCRDTPRKSGEYRVFDFVQKRADATDEDFLAALEAECSALAGDRIFRSVANGLVINRVLDTPTLFGLPGGTETAIIETRADDLETLMEYYARIRKPEPGDVDFEKSFTLVTRMKVIH
ncbi:MAG: hypothetical protein E7Z98_09610 [Olsenella sp.]|nr:hypothetical protein [Olsenella sp.]